MRFPRRSARESRPVTKEPGAPPSRSSTFSSLERQFSSLSNGLTLRKKRPVTPPPPYAEVAADKPPGVPNPQRPADPDNKMQLPPATPPGSSAAAATLAHEEALMEERFLDKATAVFAPPPPDYTPARLARPIAIPRLNPGPTVPFARAWAPSLAGHAIDQATFLTFLDNLNIVIAPHPAVTALEVAAFGVQFVPVPYSDALAGALQLAAGCAGVVLSHVRGRRYLARLNGEYFAPRGLHACIMGTKRLKAVLGVPARETLLAPLAEETLGLSAQERCLAQVERWAAPLALSGLPPPSPETDILAKFAAWRVRRRVRSADRRAARGRKRAWKRHAKGKKLREGWGEKSRVKGLGWIVIRNLDEVVAEEEAKVKDKKTKKMKKGKGEGPVGKEGEAGREAAAAVDEKKEKEKSAVVPVAMLSRQQTVVAVERTKMELLSDLRYTMIPGGG